MIALDDKYRLLEGRALMSGRQALVRLPILQRQVDRRHGLRTAGYISGYRGSPLGGYDLELWRAAEILAANDIVFSPGVNEDLALAAVAGTQQLEFVPGRKVDGVFGFWYGKGPGVDRSGDAIKHANLAGVSAAGGVVLLFGDDHAGKSSTTAHQSDLTLASWSVPVLYPSSVAEIIELGLAAVAMSRFSGLLVGLKLVNETADGSAVVDLAAPPEFVAPQLPEPAGGIHIRREMVAVQQQDARLVRHKLPRAAAFARANRLDRIVFGAATPRFVIATGGKALGDVLAALEALGIDEESAREVGIGVYRIALIFPLDADGLGDAARAAEEILFVEEKRAQAEVQAKALLFNSAIRPRISGKTAPDGTALLPADAPLTGHVVAVALAHRLRATLPQVDWLLPGLAPAAERISERLATVAGPPSVARRPAFCPGCPHNLSTKVPEGAIGATGIGCHGMAVFHPDRHPIPMMQMGGEGANWIGLSRFVATPHIFQNLGDGTYNHSGSLAVRAAVQAGTNITFKILFNDAVAMTGGQPVEGRLTVARVAQQVIAEGVKRVVVVAEEPRRFKRETLPAGTELRHRDELMAVQESLRGEGGVSVLIYDQVCAAEKRRRRKAGAFPDPDRRIFINALVCEGCGDCSAESNCLAIQPLGTDLGTKRKIDQSACNKDVSCVKGFCPSFITVEGARLRSAVPAEPADDSLQAPVLPVVTDRFDVLITGIGGSGVVTVSAILGMAARVDGLGASLYDMTGLSQKGGAVFSHVRFRRLPGTVSAARIGPGEATVVIACDLVAGVHPECLATISDRTRIFANANLTETADFQVSGHTTIEPSALFAKLAGASREELRALAATRLAEKLFGDSVAANMLMLGYAWQLGGIPLTWAAIETAIRLNGRSVGMNLAAFSAGRRAAVSGQPTPVSQAPLQEFVEARTTDLARYWNGAYAERYSALVRQAQKAAAALDRGDDLVWSVARSAYKLMAYKDEYEVARLYSDGRFRAALAQEFASIRTIKVHLAPPLLSATDPRTGRPRKMTFGAWIMPVFALLARLRRLRESPFDPFARLPERRLERALRDTYLRVIGRLTATISDRNVDECIEIARAPLEVRGYGPVKSRAAQALLDRLLRLDSTTPPRNPI